MEDILYLGDKYFYTPYIYPKWWPEDDWKRQLIGILIFNWIAQYLLYFVLCGIDYYFVFDHRLKKHPLYIKDQIKLEIKYALRSMVFQAALFAPVILLEVRGYSRLHHELNSGMFGRLNPLVEILGLLVFTDFGNYVCHRVLHHRLIYKHFHKQHHMWKVPTPFSGYSLHPVDGFMQGICWHVHVFLFPLNDRLFMVFFFLLLIWTISIHDNLCRIPKFLQPIINGAAHHTDHHMYYNYNYGQFTTLWDRVFGTHRTPGAQRGCGPLEDVLALGSPEGKIGNGNTNGYTNGKGQIKEE